MTDASRKPFWKRKRWITAAVLWLVLAYPLSYGPLVYAASRGWLSTKVTGPIFLPAKMVRAVPGVKAPVEGYADWWADLAGVHRGKELFDYELGGNILPSPPSE